jgi:hypothetical protein
MIEFPGERYSDRHSCSMCERELEAFFINVNASMGIMKFCPYCFLLFKFLGILFDEAKVQNRLHILRFEMTRRVQQLDQAEE